ncbi:MFS transporter [Ramlibacter sp. USB13]|uniref:MFS transporter n=1 Tax=Ramlibacter cellulosilyticus TaxID=2764187 RepID=A0A923SD47_9BURK|nr:MFS transporter [Ramlibacter cellulosilyticus]MBC5785651.1 MFS transporter [Ramlibacter cellulosilyticus]
MTAAERRASGSLALIFAARMLGLFLVLPVFALEAQRYPGGDDPALVGLAMGIYGLTQGVLQIPYGLASDRFGRKRVIVLGLLVFAIGSFLAAAAPSLPWLVAGRALQGAGAVSAAVTALLADQTRDVVRTKAMALVGASIGLMFAVSLVAAPMLAARIGLHGLFAVTGVLALACIAVVVWWTPPAPAQKANQPRGRLVDVLTHAPLLRLDVGVFVLHAVQLAMWVAVPALLVQAGLAKDKHWQVYLPTVLASFVVMGGLLFPLERRGYLRAVFLGSIGLVLVVQAGLWLTSTNPGVAGLAVLLFLFFCGFNVLEATQPSLASRLAPPQSRGAALGVYNTLQSLGFFAGGAVGGWLARDVGWAGLFGACAGLMLLWLVVAWPMRAPAAGRQTAEEVLADEAQAT